MEIVGRRARPRLLVFGLNENHSEAAELRCLAPTILFLDGPEGRATVRQGDWDAAVLVDCDVELAEHLFVIQFGGSTTPSFKGVLVNTGLPSFSIEQKIPSDLPASVVQLVKSELIPTIEQQGAVATMQMQKRVGAGGNPYWISTTTKDAGFEPFLLDGDDKVIAGAWQRAERQWWRVPRLGLKMGPWLSAAIDVWREADPESFPTEDWSSSPAWMTYSEKLLCSQQSNLVAERDTAMAGFTQSISSLEERRYLEQQEADNNERRLLTSQGDDLVDAVETALKELGFSVVNVDETITAPGDRLEDLRVSDPSDRKWTAIVEVRGYKKGAQLSDLMRLLRFEARFVRETGKLPDASWFVVNHFFDKGPSSRPRPLESNPLEVAVFAEQSKGLVVDTRTLFSMLMRVREGLLAPDVARRQLVTQTGWLDLK